MDQWDDLMLALNGTVKIYVDNHPDGGNDKFSHLLFAYIELSLHPRDKSYLIIVNDLYNVLLNLVC